MTRPAFGPGAWITDAWTYRGFPAIVLENGDWDGGLADLSDPSSAGIPTWIVRGDPGAGGFLPDAMLPALAARVGPGHVLTLAGAPHAPQRMFPEGTTGALLRALG